MMRSPIVLGQLRQVGPAWSIKSRSGKPRVGHRPGLVTSDLIVWIEHVTTEPLAITLPPR